MAKADCEMKGWPFHDVQCDYCESEDVEEVPPCCDEHEHDWENLRPPKRRRDGSVTFYEQCVYCGCERTTMQKDKVMSMSYRDNR